MQDEKIQDRVVTDNRAMTYDNITDKIAAQKFIIIHIRFCTVY